ncbi:MAG: SDR family NAD(P)-dependent oxidoreductase [Terriglobales bacterium]
MSDAESRAGIHRDEFASKLMFVSHETYTPARGGSASAEIHALRHIFGEHADDIVIANTKGFTGHAMGTGIEDVVAVKALETGCVPPVANFKEVDPELGSLNLSKGGLYPIEYALRLGAGFGSQISMALMRWVRTKDGERRSATKLGYEYRIADKNAWSEWLSTVAGVATPQLEVVQRTLRVRDERMAKAAKLTAAKPESAAPTPRIEVPAIQSPYIGRESATATKPNLPPVNAAAVSQAPAEQETDVVQSASVKERILSLVAEKTGYPPDMLDLDLDLEADLGVDTVKQAEVFAAVREIYKIPRDPNLKLRDFPTLAHVIQFVKDRRADVAAAETVPAPAEESEPVVVETVAAPPAHVVEVAGDEVKKRILALVVEKTGYPEDMLDLDLDLEADLGVDTVKQAEMFAAIRETYNIPRDPNLKLRDFPTLAHVIQFVHDRRPDIVSLAPPSTPTLTEPPPATPVPVEPLAELADDAVKKRILTLVVDKTGYPEDMLDLDLDLEADLGVDTVKQAEMFAAIRETYNIPRDTNLKLRDFPTLAHVIRFVYERRPDLAPAPAPITEKKFVAEVSLPTPAPQQELNDKAIREKILDIVAAKTGYPKDMLDLDLDLEADLGIDTVKQAEMFAEVRAAYNIPRDPNLKLRDFPTLALVIKFARDRAGLMDKPQAAPAAIPVTTNSEPQPKAQCLAAATFEAANRVPRRVPLPTPRPPLSVCKKTGVKLEPGQRVVIMPDTHGVATELADLLRQRGAQVLILDPKQSIDPQLKVWLTEGPVEGVYWLPALDQETDLCGMELATWREALRLRVKSLATTMRLLYEQIATPGTFLVCASRLGGKHGYDALGAIAPLGGAVVGFAKAYKRERSEALVKVVDFAADAAASKIARSIVDETLLDPGAIEIGYKSGARWTITLTEDPPSRTATGMPLDRQSVFVVTGAAGSIVSAIIADLAAASGGTFYLLDLIAEPKADNPDLKRFVNDKEGLKRDLFARIQSRGERATPALVERELAALERQQAAASAIEAVRASGGTAHYFSLDLRQPNAVADVISRIKSTHGRIDVLIHAAGLERSHSLPDKDEKEFDLVFDVKADGWFNLLRAIGDMPLGATVAFSSIAGRFGNAGQTDYSSANDLLCKLTSSLRRTRPGTRGIAIDWTAWEGIGMASRGSIPKVMEMAGIDMLPPESGVPMVRRELTMNDRQGEVVIANRLGVLMNELDPSGGVDGDAAGRELRTGPMIGRIAKVGIYDGLTIETTLDPSIQPFLYDHKIDGTPVLPGVMGIEAFTEAALCLLPGWHIDALEDVNFLAPFKFYRNEPRTLKLKVSFTPVNEHLVARCMLVGERTLPTSNAPQITTHFTGTLHLARSVSELQLAPFKRPTGPSISAEDIYKIYFHGPAYRVLNQVWLDHDLALGKMAEHLPPNHVPSTMNLVSSPRLIELCFQTAGLWEIEDQKRLGLPLHIGRIRITPDAEEAAKLYAQITRGALAGTFDAHVLTEHGKCLLQMEGYQTVSLPGSVNVGLLEPLHAEAV